MSDDTKDAVRYRFVRDHCVGTLAYVVEWPADEWDAEIDRLIAEYAGKEPPK